MGELVKGIVQNVRESGKAYGFTLDTTGKYNTYSVFKDPKPKEGAFVEFEREMYKPAEGDSPYNRWNIVKNTLKINQERQQESPATPPKPALKGGEFRTPDEMKRSSALENAVALIKDSDFENMTLDTVIGTTLHVAKHFTYFLSTGQAHKSLTSNKEDSDE